MGTDKALLAVGASTVLERTVGVLTAVVEPVLVVAAAGQVLPPLPVDVLRDELAGTGPLHALAVGLAEAARRGADAALVTATDLPLLRQELLRVLLANAEPGQLVLPVVDGRDQLLLAVWPTALAAPAHAAVAGGGRRVRDLLALTAVRRLDAAALLSDAELAAVDPGLRCVQGANTPAEWAQLVGEKPVGEAH
jgi:molybdopterin-guanine dinucleotide biosynthesis protein A